MSHINELKSQKQSDESMFRVHFYLKNVYYSSDKRLQHFLEETATRISQLAPVSIIQVHGSIKRLVDLSVGLKSDSIGCAFMQSKKKIYLYGQNRSLVEHEPVFSQSFKTFYFRNRDKALEDSEKFGSKGRKEIKYDNQQAFVHEGHSQTKKHYRQDQVSKRSQSLPIYHYNLYIFGVPLEYKERDVIHMLGQYDIKVKYYEWKMREDMQYLYVELNHTVTDHQISNLDFFIDRYPLLVAVKDQDETVNDIVLRHQVELDFEKDINEIELMRTAAHVGGVLAMIKDQYYGPRKYVVAFNNLSKIGRFVGEIHKLFKNVKVSKPRFSLRLCRLEKSFTYTNMMYNLISYENELKKGESFCLAPDPYY